MKTTYWVKLKCIWEIILYTLCLHMRDYFIYSVIKFQVSWSGRKWKLLTVLRETKVHLRDYVFLQFKYHSNISFIWILLNVCVYLCISMQIQHFCHCLFWTCNMDAFSQMSYELFLMSTDWQMEAWRLADDIKQHCHAFNSQ
jgi:hypothetical protein